MTKYRAQIELLLKVVETLPEGIEARGFAEKAARSLHAESFLDENRRVTAHAFEASRGRLNAKFCRICSWNMSLHDSGEVEL